MSEHCLGRGCKWYVGKADATCFHQGVLPDCSPTLKSARQIMDWAAGDVLDALKSSQKLLEAVGHTDTEIKKQIEQNSKAIKLAEGTYYGRTD
jgi:hypothetical protein